jgi:hypothetical protein
MFFQLKNARNHIIIKIASSDLCNALFDDYTDNIAIRCEITEFTDAGKIYELVCFLLSYVIKIRAIKHLDIYIEKRDILR